MSYTTHGHRVAQAHAAMLTSEAGHKVRTITAGVTLAAADGAEGWKSKLIAAFDLLREAKARLEAAGNEVQTIRITTNSFEVGGARPLRVC